MLTVNGNGFRIKGEDYAHPLTWAVKYHSLVEMDDEIIPITTLFKAPSNILVENQPPPPVRNKPANQEDYNYWVKMATYIWVYVVAP